jgi:hypothetical protein
VRVEPEGHHSLDTELGHCMGGPARPPLFPAQVVADHRFMSTYGVQTRTLIKLILQGVATAPHRPNLRDCRWCDLARSRSPHDHSH